MLLAADQVDRSAIRVDPALARFPQDGSAELIQSGSSWPGRIGRMAAEGGATDGAISRPTPETRSSPAPTPLRRRAEWRAARVPCSSFDGNIGATPGCPPNKETWP